MWDDEVLKKRAQLYAQAHPNIPLSPMVKFIIAVLMIVGLGIGALYWAITVQIVTL